MKPRAGGTRGPVIPAAAAAAAVLLLSGCTAPTVTVDPSQSPSTISSAPVSSPPSATSTLPLTAVTSSGAPAQASATPPTSTTPWPAELTPDQVTQAEAALEAYKAYWTLVDRAAAAPREDWTGQVSNGCYWCRRERPARRRTCHAILEAGSGPTCMPRNVCARADPRCSGAGETSKAQVIRITGISQSIRCGVTLFP